MLTDASLKLSGTINGSTVTGQSVSATGNSDYSVDTGLAVHDIGRGEKLKAVVNVLAAPTGTSPTLQIAVVQSASADLSSPDILSQTAALTLALGSQITLDIPRPDPYSAKRYVGVKYTVGGTNPVFNVFASIVKDVGDNQVNYASGFAVL